MWTRGTGQWKQYQGYDGPSNQNATTGHYDHVHVNVHPRRALPGRHGERLAPLPELVSEVCARALPGRHD